MSLGALEEWQVRPLTREVAAARAPALLAIHNLIPMVSWTQRDLLADQTGGRIYTDKWVHSRGVFHRFTDEIGGLMLAYERGPWDGFAHRSLYLHRGAIARKLQGQGLGRLLFASYLDAPPPDGGLRWVTLQTNLAPDNLWLVAFYERLGFRREGLVEYPEKTDVLMSKRWV